MGHEITDKDSMFSVGEMPWHGLGRVLEDAPTPAEAIYFAGLAWKVALRPVTTTLADGGQAVTIPTHRSVLREDTGEILGVVGEDFRPLQNEDAFAWFAPLCEEGWITLETAGSLRRGRRVWVMARVATDAIEVVPGDEVEPFVLLCHGHDGSLALRVGFNPVRVVCANTLAAALDDGDGLFCLRHTAGLSVALEDARRAISRQIEIFRGSADAWRHLAARRCDDAAFDRYVLGTLARVAGTDDGDAPETSEPGPATGKRILEVVRPLFAEGLGNDRPEARGTWWAAYNAVTQWLTHMRGSKAGTEAEQAARRFDALHLGDGRRLGRRALMLALAAADKAPLVAPAALTEGNDG